MTKYFIDKDGKYIGAFDGKDVELPTDAIEVPSAPEDYRQVWSAGKWQLIDKDQIDLDTLNDALIQKGSVMRALALVFLQEINKLRVKNGDIPYTMVQFKAILQGLMR